jgi:hypothetical protein
MAAERKSWQGNLAGKEGLTKFLGLGNRHMERRAA